MKKTIIISGGEKGGLDFSLSYKPEQYTTTYVIACDKGYQYAKEAGIRPDLIIGDFDSYEGELPKDIKVEQLPTEKDDTDTMHAIRNAVENESDCIIIACGMGGRLDHLLSNIQAARYAADHGAFVIVAGKDTICYVLHDRTLLLDKNPEYSLSVLSLSDESRVTIKGTKYEAENVVITADFPIGQSNEWQENKAEIAVFSGTAMVVTSKI